jgi:predicted nuclease with TOPRIM domain
MLNKCLIFLLIFSLLSCKNNNEKNIKVIKNNDIPAEVDSNLIRSYKMVKDSLVNENKRLQNLMHLNEVKSKYILSMTNDFNEIQNKLLSLGRTQTSLMLKSNSIENNINDLQYKHKDNILKAIESYESNIKSYQWELARIKRDMETYQSEYYHIYNENQKKINAINELRGIISNLQQELKNKNEIISFIADKIDVLSSQLNEVKNYIFTCYYVIGTDEYLLKNHLVEKKGKVSLGLFSIGGALVPRPGYNNYPSLFNSIDIRENNSISIQDHKLSYLLPPRPNSSFKIIGNQINIVNRDQFWKDKYLIIVIE